MKKLTFVVFVLLVATISTLFVRDAAISEDRLYAQHIKNMAKGKKLDGPDKASFRNAVMTINPKTGLTSAENARQAFEDLANSRTESRNFYWKQIDSEIAGRVRSIMIDPNDGNKLWAGAVTGGLWYNEDFRNKRDWVPVSDNWKTLSISKIAFDPNNTSTYYVGTGESYTSVQIYRESSSSGVGIYKTADAGSTWTLLASSVDFDYVNDILVRNESGNSVIYAGVASGIYQGKTFGSAPSDGLFRSDDGGQSWTQVLPLIQGSTVPYAVSDIELTPEGRLYVGTMRNLANEGGGKILSSVDGVNWTIEGDEYAEDIIAEGLNDYGLSILPGRVKLASSAGIVYAVGTSGWLNSFNQIRDIGFFTRIVSKENGQWSSVSGPQNTWASIPWHALAIEVSPSDANKLVIGGLDLYANANVSGTGALSWIRTSDWVSMYHFSDYTRKLFFGQINQSYSDSILNHFVHADIHDIVFGENMDEILIANDGGVHFSC